VPSTAHPRYYRPYIAPWFRTAVERRGVRSLPEYAERRSTRRTTTTAGFCSCFARTLPPQYAAGADLSFHIFALRPFALLRHLRCLALPPPRQPATTVQPGFLRWQILFEPSGCYATCRGEQPSCCYRTTAPPHSLLPAYGCCLEYCIAKPSWGNHTWLRSSSAFLLAFCLDGGSPGQCGLRAFCCRRTLSVAVACCVCSFATCDGVWTRVRMGGLPLLLWRCCAALAATRYTARAAPRAPACLPNHRHPFRCLLGNGLPPAAARR